MAKRSKHEIIIELESLNFGKAKRHFEAAFCDTVLEMADGNVSAAARLAGKDRKDFYDLMLRCDVDPEAYR